MALVSKATIFHVLVTILGLWASQAWSRKLPELSMNEMHAQWMTRFGRVYHDDAEKAMRFEIFKKNVEYIETFNMAGNKTYKLGINAFTDLTPEKFKTTRFGYRAASHSKVSRSSSFKYQHVNEVPPTRDWRQKGAVTPIKDQGQCGSCWAFSTVAAMEGITKLKTGELIPLSEQELIDCDVKGTNQGCNGGEMDDAFKFIIQNRGLTTEANYPYEGIDGTCKTNKSSSSAANITGYQDVPRNNEQALLKALANQPVSVAIDAGGADFMHYHSGIFTGSCGIDLDHGVTAVGYGKGDDGAKFWIVKNSWGTSWGEKGYIRMQREIDAKEGLCGIAMQASYPTA